MKMPSDEQLDIAMLWLENNEGDGIEGEACRVVAHWLAEQKFERLVRYIAYKNGLPAKRVRERLQKEYRDQGFNIRRA